MRTTPAIHCGASGASSWGAPPLRPALESVSAGSLRALRSPASIVLALLAAPLPALAQQPLSVFLDAASSDALDVREAEATLSQARSQIDEARARLLPSAVGQLTYQRNEPVVSVRIPTGEVDDMGMPITRQADITPADQLRASAVATVPLLDLSAWATFFQAERSADASDAQLDAVRQNVAIAVVQLWHQLVGQRALVDAAQRNLELAESRQRETAARVSVGAAAQLELSRADAEVARARFTSAEARLAATLAARNLADLTGLAPSDRPAPLEDDLAEERPLAHFTQAVMDLPAVRAARQQVRAAGAGRDAAWLALAPTITGTAAASWSNAAGFGRQDSYYAGLNATWVLDFGRPARIGTASAAVAAAEVRLERAIQQTQTAIFEAWERVQALRASAEASGAALEASRAAEAAARAQYEAGSSTQLDLIQAQRDLFQADVAHVQALANLKVARAVLRVRAGM